MDRMRDLPGVTRVEVIDHRTGALIPGVAFHVLDPGMEVAFARQDDDRTFKIFLRDKTEQVPAQGQPLAATVRRQTLTYDRRNPRVA